MNVKCRLSASAIVMAVALMFLAAVGPSAVNAQPYHNAYFTSIRVTDGTGAIELISGGTAKVYDGQIVWRNLTYYNQGCGTLGANLYTKIYINNTLAGTSPERYVWLWTSSGDNWYGTVYGPGTWHHKVQLWWDNYGTHLLEDEKQFDIWVVKLSITDWSPAPCTVQIGKGTPTDLYTSFRNGGNDYMYSVKMSIVDSAGLDITPSVQTLGDIMPGGTKSATFQVKAPSPLAPGVYTVTFQITYNDWRGALYSHSETKTAPVNAVSGVVEYELAVHAQSFRGTPLEGVFVQVTSEGFTGSGYTDHNGNIVFVVPEGVYTIKAKYVSPLTKTKNTPVTSDTIVVFRFIAF